MEITPKFLEQQFEKQFILLQAYFDKKLDEKLTAQTTDLKSYIHEAFEVQQIYIDERTLEILDNLQVQDQVNKHDAWIRKIAVKMDIKL